MKRHHTTSTAFRFFFLDRTFGILLVLLIVVAGVMAYRGIVKESFPDVNIPTAVVVVIWPGAPPELIEKKLIMPLETQILSLKGVKSYTSQSNFTWGMLIIQFEEHRPIETAMQEVRSMVGSVSGSFPRDAETPQVMQASVSMIPIATFTLHGDVDELVLNTIARKLETQLNMIKGVKKVEVSGYRREIVNILLDPARMSALGISPLIVMNAISSTDMFAPVGQFEHQDVNASVKLDARIRDLHTLRNLSVLRQQNGRVIRLGEMASIRRELENADAQTSVSFNGSEFGNTVNITLYKSAGFDTINIVKEAEEIIEEARKAAGWPSQLQYQVVSNKAEEIEEELSKVITNAGQSMLVVFCILLVMLTWRESIIAGLSIPLTFLGTFAVLWGLGYTLNTLTFIGLIIAVGLLVDDFILMMEGMHEARVKGLSLVQAQIATIKTYAVPSFSGSVTTILAFLPVLAIGGFIGQFLRNIPIATVTCLTLSYLISILIDVPLSSYIYAGKRAKAATPGRIDRLSRRASAGLSAWLKRYTVRNKWLAAGWLALTVALFGLSIAAYFQIPKTLNEQRDQRDLGLTLELPQGTPLSESQKVARHVGEQLRQMSYFESIEQYVGKRSPLAQEEDANQENSDETHLIGFTCKFLPEGEREKPSYEYLPEIRQTIASVLTAFPSVSFLLHEPKQAEGYQAAIEIEVYGPAMPVARQLADEVKQTLTQVPGAVDVRASVRGTTTDWRIEPIREALDVYQISAGELSAQLNLFFGATEVGKFMSADTEEELDMYLGMAWPSQDGNAGGPRTWQELDRIHIVNAQRQRIPLGSLVNIYSEDAPATRERKNGRTSVTVMAETEERQPKDVLDEFLPQLREMQQDWPSGYGFTIGGEQEEFGDMVRSFQRAFAFAVLLIFSTLALIFRSFRQTLIIIFSIPFALTGTFLGFFLCNMSLSGNAAAGIVSLAGIAVNDAIVLIDTMNKYRKQGFSIQDAAAQGSGDRLRPVLSTSLTTIVGLIPLALNDAEWAPLCYVIIFGLIASTLITLYVIPALYLLFTPKRQSATQAEIDEMFDQQQAPGGFTL